jgi:hypothetical protein
MTRLEILATLVVAARDSHRLTTPQFADWSRRLRNCLARIVDRESAGLVKLDEISLADAECEADVRVAATSGRALLGWLRCRVSVRASLSQIVSVDISSSHLELERSVREHVGGLLRQTLLAEISAEDRTEAESLCSEIPDESRPEVSS